MSYPGLPQTYPNYTPNSTPHLGDNELEEALNSLEDQRQENAAAENLVQEGILSTLQKMREELTEIKVSLQTLQAEKRSLEVRPTSMGYLYKPSPQSHPCFNCGEIGHWSPRCPYYNKDKAETETAPRSRQMDQCYKCQQTGHWAYECPEQTPTGVKRKPNSTVPAKKGGKTTKKVKGMETASM